MARGQAGSEARRRAACARPIVSTPPTARRADRGFVPEAGRASRGGRVSLVSLRVAAGQRTLDSVNHKAVNMKCSSIAIALVGGMWFVAPVTMAEAAPCLMVTLTGTQGGPSVFNGQAGAGTLVRYGDDSNDCAAMKLQFDAGRGTNMRLSQIALTPGQLNAIFLTHMHGDHTEGFADIIRLRWYLNV